MYNNLYLIVGLGNPGNKFNLTRHNAGFRCLDNFSQINNIKFSSFKNIAQIANIKINNSNCYLMKPITYMNLSGTAVKTCMKYFNIDIDHLIVIQDDTSLPVGKMRIRKRGSAGGHNGIKSIIESINSSEFKRIKIGVGNCPNDIDMKDWVIMELSKKDLETIDIINTNISKALPLIINGEIDEAINEFNGISI